MFRRSTSALHAGNRDANAARTNVFETRSCGHGFWGIPTNTQWKILVPSNMQANYKMASTATSKTGRSWGSPTANIWWLYERLDTSERIHSIVTIQNSLWPLHGCHGQRDSSQIKCNISKSCTTKQHCTRQMEEDVECNAGEDGQQW